MTITSQQAYEMRPALQKICSMKELPFAQKWNIAKKMAVIGVRAATVERIRLLTYESVGTKTEDGKINLTPAQAAQAESTFLPAMEEIIEVPGDPIPLSSLQSVDANISPDDLVALVPIIVDDVTVSPSPAVQVTPS